jgi:hypothetical protein
MHTKTGREEQRKGEVHIAEISGELSRNSGE